MLAGHLQEKGGKYYAVLNCKHRNGKRFPKWICTGYPVKKGTKKLAVSKLEEFKNTYNIHGELITYSNNSESEILLEPMPSATSEADILFADYMLMWLSYKETEVEAITFDGYCDTVENHIYPYFRELGITLSELEPKHLKDFYKYERIGNPDKGKRSKKGSTVVRYHANIHSALELAVEGGLVGRNVAHKQRPNTVKFVGNFYTPDEAIECLKAAEGTRVELAVFFGLFYGLRQEEIVGLKWQNFDFQSNTFSIMHTVTAFWHRGKAIQNAKDRTKNQSSMRTLPIIPLFRDKLEALLLKQKEDMKVFGNSYNKKYQGYVYVDEIGELIKPDYISTAFPKLLKKNNLRHIRFHDTRHSCASLLLRNGVSMKEIQQYLGHSDYGTTANIYAHLDMEESMLSSVEKLSNSLFGAYGQARL